MEGKNIDDIVLQMSLDDNVATALADLDQGTEITTADSTIRMESEIPFGHKVALEPISTGDKIYKYGEVIGQATDQIHPGEWVHTHNCESTRGRGDKEPTADSQGDSQ